MSARRRRVPPTRVRAARADDDGAPADRNGPPIQIREMTLDDLPVVFALGERLFRADETPTLHRTWDESELVDLFSSDGRFCLIAACGDRTAGFVAGSVIDKRRSAWTYGYLAWLGVAPQFEHRGVGRRLVARLTELFIDAGARIMLVDTEADNTRAIGFFESLGFGSPERHVYMTRNLTRLPEYRRRRDRGRAVPPPAAGEPPDAPSTEEEDGD